MTLYPLHIYHKVNQLYRHNYLKLKIKVKNPFCEINKEAIIIVGNQKSGTTAIAKLLGLATSQTVTSDFMALQGKRDLFPSLYHGYISLESFLERNKWESAQDIIKDPDFTFLYPQIREIFNLKPKLFILRSPQENIRSILNRLDISGKGSVLPQFPNMKNYAWKRVLEGSEPIIIGKSVVEVLAKRWCLAVDVYLKYKDEFHLIKYEEFVNNKKDFIESVANELNLIVRKDITPFLGVQFQPKGKFQGAKSDFFDAKNKQIIREICGNRMSILGYE